MAVPLASAADLSTLLGIEYPEFDPPTLARMNLILQLASDWARDFAKRVWSDPDAVPETVRGIVLAAARREWLNPERINHETHGPESVSYIPGAYPPGFFTDDEVKWFRKFHRTGGMYTVSTSRDSEEESTGYLEIAGGGGFMPVFNPSDPGWSDSLKLW